MALPNSRFYYWAANICCIMLWSHFKNQADCQLPTTSPFQHCLALHSHFLSGLSSENTLV